MGEMRKGLRTRPDRPEGVSAKGVAPVEGRGLCRGVLMTSSPPIAASSPASQSFERSRKGSPEPASPPPSAPRDVDWSSRRRGSPAGVAYWEGSWGLLLAKRRLKYAPRISLAPVPLTSGRCAGEGVTVAVGPPDKGRSAPSVLAWGAAVSAGTPLPSPSATGATVAVWAPVPTSRLAGWPALAGCVSEQSSDSRRHADGVSAAASTAAAAAGATELVWGEWNSTPSKLSSRGCCCCCCAGGGGRHPRRTPSAQSRKRIWTLKKRKKGRLKREGITCV